MEGDNGHDFSLLINRALDNYERFIKHHWSSRNPLPLELQQIGEELEALREITAIDLHPHVERRYKMFYRGKIDRGRGSMGGIIVDLHDNVVARFNYSIPAECIRNRFIFDCVCFIRAMVHIFELGLRDIIVYGDSFFITTLVSTLESVHRGSPILIRAGYLHLFSQVYRHWMKFHGLSYFWASCHGLQMNRAAEEAREGIDRQRMNMSRDRNWRTKLCTVCFKDVDRANMVTPLAICLHSCCGACASSHLLPNQLLPTWGYRACRSSIPFNCPVHCPNCLVAIYLPLPAHCPHCRMPIALKFTWMWFPVFHDLF